MVCPIVETQIRCVEEFSKRVFCFLFQCRCVMVCCHQHTFPKRNVQLLVFAMVNDILIIPLGLFKVNGMCLDSKFLQYGQSDRVPFLELVCMTSKTIHVAIQIKYAFFANILTNRFVVGHNHIYQCWAFLFRKE